MNSSPIYHPPREAVRPNAGAMPPRPALARQGRPAGHAAISGAGTDVLARAPACRQWEGESNG